MSLLTELDALFAARLGRGAVREGLSDEGLCSDINSASADELKTIKGIGEADAKKIVESRPYKTKDELVQKKVVPKATYDRIKDQIVAK